MGDTLLESYRLGWTADDRDERIVFPYLVNAIARSVPFREDLSVMSRDVVLAPARNDTVPIQEVSVQTARH